MSMTRKQRYRLTYLFRLYDYDRNGCLDVDDIASVVEKVESRMTSMEAKERWNYEKVVVKAVKFFHRLLREIPNDGQQQIELSRWIEFFETQMEEDDSLEEYVGLMINFMFDLFDEDHDGYISEEEYEFFYEIFDIDKDSFQKAFSNFDLNNDNRVSRYEMIRQLEAYFLDDMPGDDNNEVFGRLDG